MRDSLARVGAYEVNREMYKSCTSGEMAGHSWRQMSGQVGLSRVRAGSIPCFGLLRLTSSMIARCLCWVLGSIQSGRGPPSQSDSLPEGVWYEDDDMLSKMPSHISAQCFCITDSDAIALSFHRSVLWIGQFMAG